MTSRASSRRATARRGIGRALPALLLALLLGACGNNDPYQPAAPSGTALPPGSGSPTQPWSAMALLPLARWGLAAGVLNGFVYAIGGADAAGQPLGTVEAYDPFGDAWSPRAALPTPRSGLAAVAIAGRIYAVGGTGAGGVPLELVEIYDPATDQWSTEPSTTPLYEARTDFCTGTPDGQFFPLVGGHTGSGQTTVVWVYNTQDPSVPLLRTNNDLPVAQDYHPACEVVAGNLYALGGRSSTPGSGNTWLDANSFLDWTTGLWRARAPLPTAREGLSSGQAGGLVYAIGGLDAAGQALATVEAYDPAADAWHGKAPLPTARERAAAVSLYGRIFVLGGRAGNTALDAVERYDPGKDPN